LQYISYQRRYHENKKSKALIAFAGILFLALTPFASAQHIIEDEVWFTIKAIVNGHTLLTSNSICTPEHHRYNLCALLANCKQV
jgi:hypothetical protein